MNCWFVSLSLRWKWIPSVTEQIWLDYDKQMNLLFRPRRGKQTFSVSVRCFIQKETKTTQEILPEKVINSRDYSTIAISLFFALTSKEFYRSDSLNKNMFRFSVFSFISFVVRVRFMLRLTQTGRNRKMNIILDFSEILRFVLVRLVFVCFLSLILVIHFVYSH